MLRMPLIEWFASAAGLYAADRARDGTPRRRRGLDPSHRGVLEIMDRLFGPVAP
jgi:hypothetical protein